MKLHHAGCQKLFWFAGLCIANLACGGSADEQTASLSVRVEALSETASLTTCERQVFKAIDNSSDSSQLDFAWNMQAPPGADYSFTPVDGEFTFVARTVGEYRVNLLACDASLASGSNCASFDYVIVVSLGGDANENGIGDACESATCTPNCSDRECGVDPVCGESCGTCGNGTVCDAAAGKCAAVCVPNCSNRQCGADPICGESCGTCSGGQVCNGSGQCEAPPPVSCQSRACGADPVTKADCGTCNPGASCDDAGQCVPNHSGKVVTIVMALTHERLAYTDLFFLKRSRLAEQAVEWVSGLAKPKVLVVGDDSARGAAAAREPKIIRRMLRWQHIAADYLAEPSGGLSSQQLEGYDVVWFSNPNAAIDDARSVQVLTDFVRRGGGLVLQGEDITQGRSIEALTGLRYLSDGDYSCGRSIVRSRYESYEVRVDRAGRHAVTDGLEGDVFYYGSDIDSSVLIAGGKATVLAWAGVANHMGRGCDGTKCDKQPVIVAYDTNP